MPKLRAHLAHSLKLFQRVRRDVERLGIVRYGEAFAERLRRKPALRATYGITSWDEAAYDRAVTLGQVVAAQFSKEQAPVTEEDAAIIAEAIHFDNSERKIFEVFGVNLADELRNMMPTFASADGALISASDTELQRARELWSGIHSLALVAEMLPVNHPLKAFVCRFVEDHDSALGFARLVMVIQRARSEGTDDVVQRFRTAFKPLYDAVGIVLDSAATSK